MSSSLGNFSFWAWISPLQLQFLDFQYVPQGYLFMKDQLRIRQYKRYCKYLCSNFSLCTTFADGAASVNVELRFELGSLCNIMVESSIVHTLLKESIAYESCYSVWNQHELFIYLNLI
jgi:hypothetical protein